MIEYKGENKKHYFYRLKNFELNFKINLNFNLSCNIRDFLTCSRTRQKIFFYNNLFFELENQIRNEIIKIPNYAESKNLKPLITYISNLTINDIKFKKLFKFNEKCILSIPKNIADDFDYIESCFDSELIKLKELENKI
jgi:hypothetical protein